MNTLFAFLILCLCIWWLLGKIAPSSSRKRSPTARHYMRLPEDSRATFFLCTFSMLAKIAAEDGHIADKETQRVEDYITSKLRLDAQHRDLALRIYREAFESPLELRDYAEKFRSAFRDRVKLKDELVHILLEVSLADGQLSENEKETLKTSAILLGMTESGFERLLKERVTDYS